MKNKKTHVMTEPFIFKHLKDEPIEVFALNGMTYKLNKGDTINSITGEVTRDD